MPSTDSILLQGFITTLLKHHHRQLERQEGATCSLEYDEPGHQEVSSSKKHVRVSIVADNAAVHLSRSTSSRIPPHKSLSFHSTPTGLLPCFSHDRVRRSHSDQSMQRVDLAKSSNDAISNKPSILRNTKANEACRGAIPKESIHESSTRKLNTTQYKASAVAAAAAAALHRQSRWSSCSTFSGETTGTRRLAFLEDQESPSSGLTTMTNQRPNNIKDESPVPRRPQRKVSLDMCDHSVQPSASSLVTKGDENDQTAELCNHAHDLEFSIRNITTKAGTVKQIVDRALQSIGDPPHQNTVGGISA